jgi:MbtH protein
MPNPFDDERGSYLVIRNTEGQHSLWPDFLTVPEGWRPVHGPADRSSSTAFIDAHWTNLPAIGSVAKAD